MKVTGENIKELVRLEPLFAGDIAKVVNEAEEAKQLMRAAGFGVTGQGILETTKLLLRRHETMKRVFNATDFSHLG